MSASASVRVVWDELLTGYRFGPGHPMDPARLALTMQLVSEFGLHDEIDVVPPVLAEDSELAAVHDPTYIEAVRRASDDPSAAQKVYGLGTADDPAFPGMHEVAARIAGGTRALAEAVWQGETLHGVNVAGGLHHAMPRKTSGFCVYNDAGVAIAALLEAGVERVAYVDVDAHHGDGVERMFWHDPRVLTISVHETGTVLFPGSGFPADVGGADARGSAANVALPMGCSDAGWLRAVHAIVPPLLRAFRPQIVVSQHGADTHGQDPLAHLSVSVDAQRLVMETIHDLTHELCDGRWVALGGGGYDIVDVVPRAWTHLVAIAAHRPIPCEAEIPSVWRAAVSAQYGQAPGSMSDVGLEAVDLRHRPWTGAADADDPVDRAVITTRRAVFPHHGIDPDGP